MDAGFISMLKFIGLMITLVYIAGFYWFSFFWWLLKNTTRWAIDDGT